jgi:hypothetical protein
VQPAATPTDSRRVSPSALHSRDRGQQRPWSADGSRPTRRCGRLHLLGLHGGSLLRRGIRKYAASSAASASETLSVTKGLGSWRRCCRRVPDFSSAGPRARQPVRPRLCDRNSSFLCPPTQRERRELALASQVRIKKPKYYPACLPLVVQIGLSAQAASWVTNSSTTTTNLPRLDSRRCWSREAGFGVVRRHIDLLDATA